MRHERVNDPVVRWGEVEQPALAWPISDLSHTPVTLLPSSPTPPVRRESMPGEDGVVMKEEEDEIMGEQRRGQEGGEGKKRGRGENETRGEQRWSKMREKYSIGDKARRCEEMGEEGERETEKWKRQIGLWINGEEKMIQDTRCNDEKNKR